MKVILAQNAGFCMGVRRAVEKTLDVVQQQENGRIDTFGPLIHNPQVLQLLADRGVGVLKEIPSSHQGTVIIRAHGVPPEQKTRLLRSGADVRDATCPRVVKVQVIIDKYRKRGYRTIIIGDRDHAEVVGLMGFAGPDVVVVSGKRDLDDLSLTGPYIIVCQTTQNEAAFEEIAAEIMGRFPEGKVFNTICDSTHKRQEEVRELCRRVDAMVVVGGRASANTARLGEIAAEMGKPVFMVEQEQDLDMAALSGFDCVGVTAGASTPTWMINWVVRAIESIPTSRDGGIAPFLHRLLWLLLATNFYVSLSGGLFTYAACVAQAIPFSPVYGVIAFGYILAMHNINRFTDERARRINDPIRASFFRQHRAPILAASLLSLSGSLFLAFGLGPLPFWTIVGLSVLGILYSVRFIPQFIASVVKIRRLKEIPGSKTFFVALAWAVVIALVPVMGAQEARPLFTVAGFLLVLTMGFIRNALFDVFDVQGDRMVGKETLPVFIGEKKTLVLLKGLSAGLGGALAVLPLSGAMPPAGLGLLPCAALLLGLIHAYDRERIQPGPKLEWLIESIFPLTALCAWIAVRLQGAGG